MTNIILPINNLAYSVERPIIYDVIRKVMDITEISSKTPIRVYHDGENNGLQKNTSIDDTVSGWNKWSFTENVSMDVTEEFDPDRVLSTAIKEAENLIIFRDSSLNTIIKPVYIPCNVVITVKYKTSDKNQANRWRNNIRAKTSMGRDVNLHELTYSYGLPKETVVILKEIHRLRENISGYGEEFDDYFTKNLTTRASVISNLDASFSSWSISEAQSRVQGLFDFYGLPEKAEKDEEVGNYFIGFTYKFSYDKPTHVNMVYPNMIHNQLINKRFRTSEKPYSLDYKKASFTSSSEAFSKFQAEEQVFDYYGNKGLDIPWFDNDFRPNSIPSGSARVFTVLTSITPDNKRFLFNLNDLGDFQLHPEIIKFIKDSELGCICKAYGSIIQLNLFENNQLKEDSSLEIDSDLNVYSTYNLDLRKTYRVRFGLVVNPHFLNNYTLGRIKSYIKQNPVVGKKLHIAIDNILKDIGYHKDVGINKLGYSELVSLGIIMPNFKYDLDPSTDLNYDPNEIHQKLTQVFFIVAEKG